ncbi:PWI domain-containing protein, partial [Suhomyces tanzawaensis NRRL Y-17324]
MSYRVHQIDDDYLERQRKKDKAAVKYPKCFKTAVDISKVNLPVVKEWITDKINEQLPDDDIVIDYLYELLQANGDQPDIRGIQVQLNDFLGQDEARQFCEKLWKLMISAQDDPDGIPAEILEKRKKEYEELEKKEQVPAKKEQVPEKRKTNYNRSTSKDGESK